MRLSKGTLKNLSMIFIYLFININFFLQEVCRKLFDFEFSYIKFHNLIEIFIYLFIYLLLINLLKLVA